MRGRFIIATALFIAFFSQQGYCIDYSGFMRNRIIKNDINKDSIMNPSNQIGLSDNIFKNTCRFALKQMSDNSLIGFDVEGDKDLLNENEKYNIVVNEGYYFFYLPGMKILTGKKKIDWGVGFAWNPSDQINKTKNPLDIYENREGSSLLKLNFNFLDFDISSIYQLSSSDSKGRIHLKIGNKIKDFDIAYYYSQKPDMKKTAGFMGAGYLSDNLEFHFEAAAQRGKDQPLPIYNSIADVYSFSDSSDSSLLTNYLLGLRYSLSENNFYVILEYLRNNSGYSDEDGSKFFEYLNSIEKKALKTSLDTYYITKSIEIGSGNFQSQYGFLSIRKSNNLNTFEFGLDSIFCLSDGSGVIMPIIKKIAVENLEIQLRLLHFMGPNFSKYGSSAVRNELILDCSYYF